MVQMTGEERKVANFLTDKKFKWKFQPSVSVLDEGDRTRLFSPDFLLTHLNIYIEVCGAERDEHYERTREIYKKNNVPIIYVETYKDDDKWKYFLIQRINEIQEFRQSTVSNVIPQNLVVNKPNYDDVSKEISAHINRINQESKQKEVPNNINSKQKIVSEQSQVGVMLTVLGIIIILSTFAIVFWNILIAFIVLIVGFIVFYFGIHITSYRFSRWFKKWYKTQKENFQKWLDKY